MAAAAFHRSVLSPRPQPLLVVMVASFLTLPQVTVVSGELQFDPLEPPPRVFIGAPAGQLVTQVRARDLSDLSVRPTYSMPRGADFAQFRLNAKNGRLYTRRPVKRRVNDTYELAVIAYGGGESLVRQISVRVSEKNVHSPEFSQAVYSVEVPVNAVAGTPLVRVRATDNDTAPYNRQLVYGMTGASDAASRYLTLDSGTGQISLRRRPTQGISALNVTVSARDLGSPTRRTTAEVRITFRNISEPLDLRTVPRSDTSVIVCWRRPRLGAVNGYLLNLTFEESSGGNITRLVRRHRAQLMEGPRQLRRDGLSGYLTDDDDDDDDDVAMENDEQCTVLGDLHPWTTYHLVVHGFRESETGMASDSITFGTRRSPCAGSVCGPGTCRRSAAAPGYNCYCPEGIFGQRCELRDPCFNKPCRNLGVCHNISSSQFECSCMAGFHGETCTDFNPCLSQPPPCQNGGTCSSNITNQYECECPPLYKGDTCDTFDPCQEDTCNNGTCHVEDDEYYCDCALGYKGDHCELEANACDSSPCSSGATCVGDATGFICLCPDGFTSDDCSINIDDCASQPCKHGGVCTDGVAEFICTCPDGYAGHLCQKSVVCRPEVEDWDGGWGRLEWPETPSGRRTALPCPGGSEGAEVGGQPAVATRRCLRPTGLWQQPQWEPADMHLCEQQLTALAQNISVRLRPAGAAAPSELDSAEFSSVAQQLADIMPGAAQNTQVARSVLQSVSHLMESSSAQVVSERHAAAAAGRLARALEHLAISIPLDDDDDDDDEDTDGEDGGGGDSGGQPRGPQRLEMSSTNVAMATVEYSGADPASSIGDLDLYPALSSADSNGTGSVLRPVVATDRRDPTGARVRVPAAVLQRAGVRQRRLRLIVISYRTSRLFPAQQERVGPDPGVITVTIPGFNTSRLTEPVQFGLGAASTAGYRPRCVYWKEDELSWSEQGVTTEVVGDQAVCSTSHLSSFSVLFDPVADPIGGLHERILSILSYIGAGLSLLGLVLTILTYTLFRCLTRERQGKILLNLCVSLLLMNVMFLVSNLRVLLPSSQFCITTAVLIHYLVLTSLCWMLVEAINMYQLIITVFATSESSFMLKRLLFAWGLPAAVVMSALISDNRMYYQAVDDQYCVISARQPYIFYISFFGPGCVMLVINVIVFIMVSRVLFQQRTLGKFGTVRKSISFNQVRGAFTVMALLGASWIFGVFAIGRARIVFSYVFTILNSTQGFIIFVSRCVQYPEARLAWLTLIKTGRRKHRRGSAPGSSSQAHKKGSLPGSRAAVNSVTYSLSSSSEGGWPGRPDAWRATGPRQRGSQPPEQIPPQTRPEPASPPPPPPPPEPETETELVPSLSPEPGGRQRRFDRLSRRQSAASGDKEGTDTSWQFVRATGSACDLAAPPQTFNVLVNQAGGERLRRSVSVGLPPASAPLSPRHRYRSHGDVTRPAVSDVMFSRPGAYDERELPLRRSHWDPLNYGSDQRHGRTAVERGRRDDSDAAGDPSEGDSLQPQLAGERREAGVGQHSPPSVGTAGDGGSADQWPALGTGTDTLVSRSRLADRHPPPPADGV